MLRLCDEGKSWGAGLGSELWKGKEGGEVGRGGRMEELEGDERLDEEAWELARKAGVAIGKAERAERAEKGKRKK